ncbi:protein SHQ1 homolog [Haliotis rubra]|uniref:protein SHQ1 homolog n=1 Tax=Haliotis rubra TaxID=36100 RepID=UPI001EE62F99|nr:protein SHQ1 homolog [Haliotis rubra]
MLTPSFELFQDDIFLTIVIKAPFTKVSETEIFIEDSDFKFYSKPYFLRLNLPGNIVEDGRETANYDADAGTFTIRAAKQTAGQVFDGLDMLTKLLAPRGDGSAKQPTIEVMGEESILPSDALPDEEDIDWSVEQTPFMETSVLADGHKYGFGCLRSGVFKRLQSELCEVVDLRDPDSVAPEERRAQRKEEESHKFDDDHYLADLYQDDLVQHLLSFRPPWDAAWKQLSKGGKRKELVTLTEEEKEKMRKLPNKEFLIDSSMLPSVYLSLVDVIFCYMYSYRVTEGEHNVESGWTISKLSATLSWLETFSSLQDVMATCYRRCLCFPLHRHWSLLETVREDTCRVLSLGRRQVLKCLLDVQTILTDTEQRYILNDLYINDYCVWIQGIRNEKLETLASALRKINICKSDVDLSLEELEAAAQAVMEEEEGIVRKLEKLSMKATPDADSDDSSDGETDSEEDSEDTDSSDHSTDDQITGTDKEERSTHSDDINTQTDDTSTQTDDINTQTDDTVKQTNDTNTQLITQSHDTVSDDTSTQSNDTN